MPDDFAPHLLRAFDALGVTDRSLRAGIAALCFGETGFKPHTETGYAHTSNDRIRQVFRTRCGPLTDDALNALKADPVKFFNFVYRAINGNVQIDDGYLYRGRGPIQLTGRANYAVMSRRIGVDLVANPDLANDPETGALVAVDYMLSRGMEPGWTFEQMKRAVGNAVGGVEEAKDAAFVRFMQSGEWGGDSL